MGEVAVSVHDKVKEYFRPPEPLGLEAGLAKTVAWYRSKGKFFKPVEFASVEVIAQMPPSWVREDLLERPVCEGSRVRMEAIDDDRDTTASVCDASRGET